MKDADPLKREVPAHEVPLKSPMPRSPILDREQPEQSYEEDIPKNDGHDEATEPSPEKRRQK